MPWKIQGGGPTPWGEEQITTGWSAPDWDAEVGAFRKSSGGLGIDYYLEEIFDSAPIGHPERLPKKVFWNRNGKKPPTDCMAFFSHFIVSSRVRDLIEELEPRVHEFFQIELFNMKSEERWPEPYWFLHIRNVLDSVIDELSEINRVTRVNGRPRAGEVLCFMLQRYTANTFGAMLETSRRLLDLTTLSKNSKPAKSRGSERRNITGCADSKHFRFGSKFPVFAGDRAQRLCP